MVWLPLDKNPKPPTRKDVGTVGRKIKLRSNYFPIQIKNPDIHIIHYDVKITEHGKDSEDGKIPKRKRMTIFETMKTQNPNVFARYEVAFDSEKNAYCISNIPQLKKGSQYEVNVTDPQSGRSSKYNVTLKAVNHGNLKELLNAFKHIPGQSPPTYPKTVFQMLQVMFQHYPSTRYFCVGRNTFYSCEGEFGNSIPLGGGKEGLVGFFSSLKPCAWKDGSLLLNIDIAHTAFYKEQKVLDFMKEVLRFRDDDFHNTMDHGKRKRLSRELKGLKVQAMHSRIPRTYKVTDVTEVGADRVKFPLTDPDTNTTTNCTVQKYFLKQYNKRLQYPALNCLKVGPANRTIYIPIEVCKIYKGQKLNKKLEDREASVLIKETAKRPSDRLRSINNIAKAKNFSSDPLIKSLQFTIGDQPVNMDGRVLPTPSLKMNNDFEPRDGAWDIRDKTFFTGATIDSWVVMNYAPGFIRNDDLMRFLSLLKKLGQERGMAFADPVTRESRNPNPEHEFIEIKKRVPKVQLILVVLPDYGDVYARVKKIGDREIKVVSQCIKHANVKSNKPATVSNLLLKINAKMGGVNNVLSPGSQTVVFTSPVMIMGADVNHPPAGDKSTPSLAAVVASYDRYASKYAVEVRHQTHRTEMIQDMKNMTKNLLVSFYQATKRKPERIVMYRDGVSDSQFLEVLSYELKAMRDACTSLEPSYQPAITFLVVQKRHHTRLFCDERDGVGRSKNIPPGTTVDTVITHPTERDFFLCSHQGILGTSRPTHYHLLWDDSDLEMNVLQQLTYALCHLFSRATKSVSIPAPANYAHLAAFRAKVHISDLVHSETSSLASGEASAPSDAIMAQACKMEKGNGIFSKFYYV